MGIKKFLNKVKSLLPRGFEEIDGVRFYKINNHTARVHYDPELSVYVGIIVEYPSMANFFTYYEADIKYEAIKALKSYLAFAKTNQ